MNTRPHDPGADPEDEGMPDMQDGTPEQQESSDPQQLPVAGDEPTIAEERDTTVNEVIERETLDERLADEEPEVDAEGEAGLPEELPGCSTTSRTPICRATRTSTPKRARPEGSRPRRTRCGSGTRRTLGRTS